jgi:hypothetical protein
MGEPEREGLAERAGLLWLIGWLKQPFAAILDRGSSPEALGCGSRDVPRGGLVSLGSG